MFKNPPECEKPADCRFVSLGGSTTLIHWTETYDRSGLKISNEGNPNKVRWHWHCSACGKQWSE